MSVPVNPPFSFSKFAGFATMATWTLGWWLVASHVINHLSQSDSGNTTLSLVVSLLAVTLGCVMSLRLFPRYAIPATSQPTPKESWFRRATGWFGAIIWCGAGVIWNLAIFRVLIESADKGRNANFVILIPFSAVGLLLLLVLFTSIALVLDAVFRLPNETGTVLVEPEKPIAEPPIKKNETSPVEFSWKDSPVLSVLFLVSFVNWFVFFAVGMYLGGDAIGILPSQQGFIVKNHGHHAAVSESAWVFSLFYSAATLLITPLIWLVFGVKQGRKQFRTKPLLIKIVVGLFLSIWCAGWYFGVGGAFLRSFRDWQKLKQQSTPIERVGK